MSAGETFAAPSLLGVVDRFPVSPACLVRRYARILRSRGVRPLRASVLPADLAIDVFDLLGLDLDADLDVEPSLCSLLDAELAS